MAKTKTKGKPTAKTKAKKVVKKRAIAKPKVAKKRPASKVGKVVKKRPPVKKKISTKTKGTASIKDPLLEAVIKGLEEKKGRHIVCLDLKKIPNRVSDYFVICEGDSTTQVEALADSVENEVIKATKERPYHAEGFENKEWILIDYITVVVHIFQSDIRRYYNLEGLWADAEIKEFS